MQDNTDNLHHSYSFKKHFLSLCSVALTNTSSLWVFTHHAIVQWAIESLVYFFLYVFLFISSRRYASIAFC